MKKEEEGEEGGGEGGGRGTFTRTCSLLWQFYPSKLMQIGPSECRTRVITAIRIERSGAPYENSTAFRWKQPNLGSYSQVTRLLPHNITRHKSTI